jgi:GNAT superfamily N-acetyltransferase
VDRASDLTVRRLRPDEATRFRALRLRALADAPDAFGERLVDVREKPDGYWDELTRSVTGSARQAMFVAETAGMDADDGAGMVFGLRDAQRENVARFGGMWVAPAHRGSGVARLLVDAVIAWARGEGFSRIELWVTEGNDRAETLYESCGFSRTGERRPLASNPALTTIAMARAL